MPLPLKEIAKLNQIVERIQSGRFDANDVDNLLMKLRPYSERDSIFFEVANFVAHADARDRGLAQQSITAFVDSIRYFQEYTSDQRQLNIDEPFPSYIYRFFLSQAHLADEHQLKSRHRMSRTALVRKIETNFKVDKNTSTCRIKAKCGIELRAALSYIIGFIRPKAAFHLRDFHAELKGIMHAQRLSFKEGAWQEQIDRMSLAILCLISNTEFVLPNGDEASCRLSSVNHFRLLSGERRLPVGGVTTEPTRFGSLIIVGDATVSSAYKQPLRVSFPLIDTDLDPHEHCDLRLFIADQAPEDFGDCMVEVIDFAKDMSLSTDFKLVRTDSLI